MVMAPDRSYLKQHELKLGFISDEVNFFVTSQS
jgi:hypothetical protein